MRWVLCPSFLINTYKTIMSLTKLQSQSIDDNITVAGVITANYNGLIGVLIEAIKEIREQINTMKQEIENLKK